MLSNSYERIIEWGDCDPANIVFNPNFFAFFDQGTTLLYGAAGFPKKEMVKIFDAVGAPVVMTSATFHAPCTFGDKVTIVTAILELGSSSFSIQHQLYKGEVLCVEGVEKRVWTIRDKGSGAIRSAPLPQRLREAFEA